MTIKGIRVFLTLILIVMTGCSLHQSATYCVLDGCKPDCEKQSIKKEKNNGTQRQGKT